MEYKVISIVPVKKSSDTGTELAKDLETTIAKYSIEGWEYVRIETISAYVHGSSGCFGLSNTPGYFTTNYFIVFKK